MHRKFYEQKQVRPPCCLNAVCEDTREIWRLPPLTLINVKQNRAKWIIVFRVAFVFKILPNIEYQIKCITLLNNLPSSSNRHAFSDIISIIVHVWQLHNAFFKRHFGRVLKTNRKFSSEPADAHNKPNLNWSKSMRIKICMVLLFQWGILWS